MAWHDFLKGLIEVHVNINVNPTNIERVTINNNQAEAVEYNEEKKELSISPPKLKKEEREALDSASKSAVKEEGYTFIDENSEKIVEDFNREEDALKEEPLLKYFDGKIPHSDSVLLEAALFVRKLFEKKNPEAKEARMRLLKKGSRAKNICNLCSAGYFETVIKPLHEEMEKSPDFSYKKFLNIYNVIIDEAAFAVFIHLGMDLDEVESKIREKIKRNRKYGVEFVNVHGISYENVSKIKKVIADIENEYPEIDVEIKDSKKNIIFSKLWIEDLEIE